MKKFVKLALLILSALSLIIFARCSSEEIPGPQGEEGPEGPQGEKGEPGSVDIYYSEWIDSGFPSIPNNFVTFDIQDENINTDLLDEGIFLAYGKTPLVITSIPITFNSRSYYYFVFTETNIVRFAASTTNNSDVIFNNYQQFRYIIIPVAEMPTNRGLRLEKLSYEEVCKLYNISD